MVEEQAVSLFVNLAATGITAGSGVASRKAQNVLRRRAHQEDLEHVATELSKVLRQSIADVDARTETNELADVADNYLRQSLNSYRALDDEQNQAEVLRDLGTTLLLEGRLADARSHFEESLDMDVEVTSSPP